MYLLEQQRYNLLVWTTRYHEKDEYKGMRDLNGLTETVNDLFAKEPTRRYLVLADTRPVFEQAYLMPRAAREAFSELLRHPQIRRVAVLGANQYLTRVVEMLFLFTEKWKKIRMFRDKDRALKWLQQQPEA